MNSRSMVKLLRLFHFFTELVLTNPKCYVIILITITIMLIRKDVYEIFKTTRNDT